MKKIMETAGRALGLAGTVLALSGAAQAAEVYGGIGLPGVMIGYAHPINDRFTLRGDVATLGSRSANRIENSINYSGTIKVQRAGVFADWFVLRGGLRATGGLTFNKIGLDLAARTALGENININGVDYPQGGSLDVSVKFPSTTPYLGIGYGHHAGKGLSFVWDLGASVGRTKVTATLGGALAAVVSQADLDAELAEIRDGVGKVRIFPQASVAVSYRF